MSSTAAQNLGGKLESWGWGKLPPPLHETLTVGPETPFTEEALSGEFCVCCDTSLCSVFKKGN